MSVLLSILATLLTELNSASCRLQKMKIKPRVKDGAGSQQYPYVLFSAPPSGSADYPAEVRGVSSDMEFPHN